MVEHKNCSEGTRAGVEIVNLIAVESFDCSKIFTSITTPARSEGFITSILSNYAFQMKHNSILFPQLHSKKVIFDAESGITISKLPKKGKKLHKFAAEEIRIALCCV